MTGLTATGIATDIAAGTTAACAHCGTPLGLSAAEETSPTQSAERFCCHGCAAAYQLIGRLGLADYYRRRTLDAGARPVRPEAADSDLSAYIAVSTASDGLVQGRVEALVDGLHCAACVWLIETVLAREPSVTKARLNMTTRRLDLRWSGDAAEGLRLAGLVQALGYRLVPLDPACLARAEDRVGAGLLRALAVAGFASGNVMLLSIGIWAGHVQGMGDAARTLLHWVSAIIALPCIAYAGQPFFRSALAALKQRRTNMDVPISIGVILATAMSFAETLQAGQHAYFDSAATLLFFLLIGRVLDHRARGAARRTAEQVLALRAVAVTVLDDQDRPIARPAHLVQPGDRVLVASGERLGVDGTILTGDSALDTALVTGEAVPRPVRPGDAVHAGMVNLGHPLTLRATATGEGTLLAEIGRLMEAAEARRGGFVALADRIARRYAPVVHLTALITFLGWWLSGGADLRTALSHAVAVLIITCPCALALAVPVVQVLASARLLKRGILLKTATAQERLAAVDTIVFDKTGTLTCGMPTLIDPESIPPDVLAAAARLARASRHPLARALASAAGPGIIANGVEEVPGQGMRLRGLRGDLRLGSARFCGVADGGGNHGGADGGDAYSSLWFCEPNRPPVRFRFADAPRPDAAVESVALKALGYRLILLSGDREGPVSALADRLGIADWRAGATPVDKVAVLERLRAEGRQVLMVGDGLNDAPALAAATVSMSPATASDIAQTAADVVFQGDQLAPVRETLVTARRARRLMAENLAIALGYNALAVPLAMAGFVTPLVAALAMSSSSLLVIVNAFRLKRTA